MSATKDAMVIKRGHIHRFEGQFYVDGWHTSPSVAASLMGVGATDPTLVLDENDLARLQDPDAPCHFEQFRADPKKTLWYGSADATEEAMTPEEWIEAGEVHQRIKEALEKAEKLPDWVRPADAMLADR